MVVKSSLLSSRDYRRVIISMRPRLHGISSLTVHEIAARSLWAEPLGWVHCKQKNKDIKWKSKFIKFAPHSQTKLPLGHIWSVAGKVCPFALVAAKVPGEQTHQNTRCRVLGLLDRRLRGATPGDTVELLEALSLKITRLRGSLEMLCANRGSLKLQGLTPRNSVRTTVMDQGNPAHCSLTWRR